MHFVLGMMTKTRGTAVVEYAVLLLVLVSLAALGWKRLGGRTFLGASDGAVTINDGLRQEHAEAKEKQEKKSEARHHESENRSRRH